MSNSREHDKLFPALERWLRESCGCRHVVIEMNTPNRYQGKSWPSVDLYGFQSYAHESITIDVKANKADSDAQLRKPYVLDPRLNVGRLRYIATDYRTPVSVPDGYGLVRVLRDGTTREIEHAIPAPHAGRNWQAECCYAEMAWRSKAIDEQGGGQGAATGVHAARGLEKECLAVLGYRGQEMLAREIAREVGDRKWQDVERALKNCPDAESERVNGLTYWMKKAVPSE